MYIGGFTARMNPDGTNVEIIGHNYRNSYEQSVTSLGDVFQNDNDDPPACRVSLGDGVRQLRLLVERRPAELAGGSPAWADRFPSRSGGRTIRA